MPLVTIDDIPVEVPEGTTILEAARMIGGDIVPPAMCYYTKLKTSGGYCRTCIVKVTQGSTANPNPMPKPVARRRCMLDKNVLTVGLDADHTLGVKGAPCSIALLGLAKITAANDISLCSRRAGPLDFLPVARVELNGAHHAISLVELHADDAAASVGDEFLDEGGLVHGKK